MNMKTNLKAHKFVLWIRSCPHIYFLTYATFERIVKTYCDIYTSCSWYFATKDVSWENRVLLIVKYIDERIMSVSLEMTSPKSLKRIYIMFSLYSILIYLLLLRQEVFKSH